MMEAGSERGIDFAASVAPGVDGGSVVTVFGELDISTSVELRPAIEQALDAGGDVEIDLRGCSFIDSSGIAVLAWAAWQLRGTDRRLRLRGARPRIVNIFERTGLAEHSSVVLEPAETGGE
jgi:anti-sigma B factor antagonist